MAATMTVKSAAEILGVHENSIRNWINQGRLAYVASPGGNKRPLISAVNKMIPEVHPVADLDEMASEMETAAKGYEDRAAVLRALAQRIRSGEPL